MHAGNYKWKKIATAYNGLFRNINEMNGHEINTISPLKNGEKKINILKNAEWRYFMNNGSHSMKEFFFWFVYKHCINIVLFLSAFYSLFYVAEGLEVTR